MFKRATPLVLTILAGCATGGNPSPQFSGETLTDAQLRKDVMTNALLFTGIAGCTKIDRVDTQVTSQPSDTSA